MLFLPELQFFCRHDIPGIGKGRDPFTVDEPGVPANMIHMQVGTEDKIDILWGDASGSEMTKPGRLHAVPVPIRHALFIIADTAIDQDIVMRCLDQPRVHAGNDTATVLIAVMRVEPVSMTFENICMVGREELGWVKQRADQLFDAGYSSVAQLP